MSQEKPDLHNQIAKLCLDHFDALPKCGKPNKDEWTTLSCIVQESGNGELEVVALGTGTKCIGHNKMSVNGDILNDSHAEVICRRAFLRYIYENMLSENNLFLKLNVGRQKFILKNDFKFHFFTTHVPCGDAAIFGKKNEEHFGDILTETNQDSFDGVESKKRKLEAKSSEDIYRTGAKCLVTDVKQDLKSHGAEYHVTGVVRTKPGRGVQTLSVSCSDKIAKWCHLGIQGALLSVLLDKPIYLNRFIMVGGTPYNQEAMERAFFNRLGNVHLKCPYHTEKIIFNQANITFVFSKSNEKRPCPSSVIWTKTNPTDKKTEVAVDGRRQGVTKKQMKTSGMLKISKKELFKYFVEVVKTYNIQIDNINNLIYKEAKLLARSYQDSWEILKREHFNIWTVKNDNLLYFNIK